MDIDVSSSPSPAPSMLLSTFLPHAAHRWGNLITGWFMTLIQIGTLFRGSGPTTYYAFFSVVEIASTAFIVS